MNILLTVTRRWQTQQSTISTVRSSQTSGKVSKPVSGFILEPKGPSTIAANQNLRIPAGIYKLKWHRGRFPGKRPLLYNNQVSASRCILIHEGNFPRNTIGCLLPGSSKGTDYVGASRAKLRELLEFLDGYDLDSGNFSLKIEENFDSPSPLLLPANTLLTVTRRWQTQQSTISSFTSSSVDTGIVSESSVSGYILEPKGPSTIIANQNLRIPAGIYKLQWHSGKFPSKRPLLHNHEVPVSRCILIHEGNFPRNTTGCLLPGSSKSTDYVGASQAKLRELLEFLDGYDLDSGNFSLKIEENFE